VDGCDHHLQGCKRVINGKSGMMILADAPPIGRLTDSLIVPPFVKAMGIMSNNEQQAKEVRGITCTVLLYIYTTLDRDALLRALVVSEGFDEFVCMADLEDADPMTYLL
jgi:hypothetical protein